MLHVLGMVNLLYAENYLFILKIEQRSFIFSTVELICQTNCLFVFLSRLFYKRIQIISHNIVIPMTVTSIQ